MEPMDQMQEKKNMPSKRGVSSVSDFPCNHEERLNRVKALSIVKLTMSLSRVLADEFCLDSDILC